MRWREITRWIAIIAGLFYLVGGLWAFFAPRSFFEALATFPPYNRHFLHDVGSFQIGLGLMLLLALRWRDALFVAFAANAVGAAFHLVSHIIDQDLGGRATDPFGLGTLLLVLALGVAVLQRGAADTPAADTPAGGRR